MESLPTLNQPENEHDNTASLFGLNDLQSENIEQSEQLSGDDEADSSATWDMLEDRSSVVDFKKHQPRGTPSEHGGGEEPEEAADTANRLEAESVEVDLPPSEKQRSTPPQSSQVPETPAFLSDETVAKVPDPVAESGSEPALIEPIAEKPIEPFPPKEGATEIPIVEDEKAKSTAQPAAAATVSAPVPESFDYSRVDYDSLIQATYQKQKT